MSEIDPIYKELASKIQPEYHLEDSKYFPRILAKLANLEQARIIRELPDSYREASTGRLEVSEEFAKKLNLDKAIIDKHLQELFEKGLLFPTKKGPQMARHVIQLHDTNTNPKFDEELGDDYFKLWLKFLYDEWLEGFLEEMVGGEYPTMRVIPRWKSIKDIPGVLPCEDIKEILKVQDAIVVVPCTCKRFHRERRCGIPEEVCICIGRNAQYNMARGHARKLTAEEALHLLDEMDKYPVIHTTFNQSTAAHVICNCHWCCCELLLLMLKQDKHKIYEGIAKSRFEVVIEPEKCTASKICLDMCQFGAIQMKYYPEFGGERAYIDAEKCVGCGCCVINCPDEALTMKIVRPPEHIPEVASVVY